MQNNLLLSQPSYASKNITKIILRGTMLATITLATLLVVYNGVIRSLWFDRRTWIICIAILFLLTAEILLRKNRKHQHVVDAMLILFYMCLAFGTLLTWGLNAPVGILTISFAVILPSILMGVRAILPVTCLAVLIIILVQIIHGGQIITPNLAALTLPSTYWDVITYSTILIIFALTSWVSESKCEKSLKRALRAEAALRAQKNNLSIELEKESAALRQTRLDQVGQLHKFALLGQSTAATLHELSSHLSVLNLDIDDLQQQHTNSRAIANAKTSIDTINKTVRQARRQLDSYDQDETFNAISAVNQSIKDANEKFSQYNVRLVKSPGAGRTCMVQGSSLAFMHILAILLNNALDACRTSPNPKVTITINHTVDSLTIHISDNGPGIDPEVQHALFSPKESTKETGLGIGLYIARHLTKYQFGGKLKLAPQPTGAHFVLTIPRETHPSE